MSDHNQASYTRRRNILNQSNSKCLKCSRCDFSTNWPLLLKRHLWTLHGKCVYKCDKCSFRTYKKKSMDSHKQRYLNFENCNLKKGKYSKNLKTLNLVIDSIKQEIVKLVSNDMGNVSQKSSERIKLNLKENSNKKSRKHSLLKCTNCDFKSYFQIKFEKHIQNHLKCDIQDSSGMRDKIFMENTAKKRLKNGRFRNIISSENKKLNSEVLSINFNYFDNKSSKGETSDLNSKDSADKRHTIGSENVDMNFKESNNNISLGGITRIEACKRKREGKGLHNLKYTTKYQKVLQDSNYKESRKNIPFSEIKTTRMEVGIREMAVVLHDLKYTTNVNHKKILEEQLKIKNNTLNANSKDYRTVNEASDFDFCGFENFLTDKKNIEYGKHIAENFNKIKFDIFYNKKEDRRFCTLHSNGTEDNNKLLKSVQNDNDDIKNKNKMSCCCSCDKSFKFRHSNNIFHKCRNCGFETHMLLMLYSHEVKCFTMRSPKSCSIQTKKKSVLANINNPFASGIYDSTNEASLSSWKNDRFMKIKKQFLISSKIRDKKLLNFPHVSIALDNKLKFIMEEEVKISPKHSNNKNKSPNRKSKLDSIFEGNQIISSYTKMMPHNENNEISQKKNHFDNNLIKTYRKSSINSNSVSKFVKKNDNTKWQCQICDYTSKNLSDHKSHLNITHNDLKRFNCKFCDYKNNVKLLLKKHYIRYHSSVIVERCKESSDSVTREDILMELCLPDKNAMNISLSYNSENKKQTIKHKNDENLDVLSNCQTKKQSFSLNTFKRKKSFNLSRNDGLKNRTLFNSNQHKPRDHKIGNKESCSDYKTPLLQNDIKQLTLKSKIECNENVRNKFVAANNLSNEVSMQNTSNNNKKKIYECLRCHYFTHSVSALGRHTLNECRVRRYGCKKCTFITNQLQLIIEHSSFHHKEFENKEEPVKYENLKNRKSSFNDLSQSTRLVSVNDENSTSETSNNKKKMNNDKLFLDPINFINMECESGEKSQE